MNEILRKNWPESYGFSIFGHGPSYVISVEKDSIAHHSGLCPGDELIEIDGFNVSSMSDEMVKTIARSNTLESPIVSVTSKLMFLKLEADEQCGYGLTFQGEKPTLVATVDPTGPAYSAGVKPNDIILEINGHKIKFLQLASSLLREKHGNIVLAMIVLNTAKNSKHGENFSTNENRIGKAKLIYFKMNEIFESNFKRKMILVKLLKSFAEDRNVEIFAKSIKILLDGRRGESLIIDLRKFVPMLQKVRFDEILNDKVIDSKERNSLKEDFDTRNVTLRKDRDGYGFTVIGPDPVKIDSVIKGSPADKGGVKTEDIIMKINGLDIRNVDFEYITKLLKNSRKLSFELATCYQSSEDDISDVISITSSSSIFSTTIQDKDGLKTLITSKAVKDPQHNLTLIKQNRILNKLASSILNRDAKKSVQNNIFQNIDQKNPLFINSEFEDYDEDGASSQDFAKERISETDSNKSIISSENEFENRQKAFKKDLNLFMKNHEKQYLRQVLQIYNENKNVDDLIDDLCYLLDTPSKQLLWNHIIQIIPHQHKEYLKKKLATISDKNKIKNFKGEESVLMRETYVQTTPLKSPNRFNKIISPDSTEADESFVKSEQSLKIINQPHFVISENDESKFNFFKNKFVQHKTLLEKSNTDIITTKQQGINEDHVIKEIKTGFIPTPPPLLQPDSDHPGVNIQENSLKRINWEKLDKVDESSIWAKIKKSENMEEVIKHLDLEQHFAIKPPNQFGFNNLKHFTGILNARKAYNLSILLKQTKISEETLKQSLIELNENLVGEEILKHLVTFAPDSDEIRRYQEFNGLVTDLNEADQFTLQMCRIPLYKTRLRALHFKVTFLERISDIRKKLHVLRKAVHELLRSEKLTKILEITLALGNYMNKGNLRVGEATGFKISFLSQIETTRSNIGAKTFLHSLVEAVQTKFPLACQISQDLPSIHEAATISEAAITTDLNEMKQTIKDILVALKDSPETNTHFTYQQQEFFMGANKEIETLTEEHIDFMTEFKHLGYYFGGIPKNTTITEFFKMFSDFLNKFENALHFNSLNRIKNQKSSNK